MADPIAQNGLSKLSRYRSRISLCILIALFCAPLHAQNPTISRASMENALVTDAGFISRVSAMFVLNAVAVLNENGGTANHAARAAFATKVLQTPRTYAERAAGYLIHTDNFEGQVIQITPLGSGFAVTIATPDADASGQIFAVWNTLVTLFG